MVGSYHRAQAPPGLPPRGLLPALIGPHSRATGAGLGKRDIEAADAFERVGVQGERCRP